MTAPLTYFKRYRMELELSSSLPRPVLPDGFAWVAWNDSHIDTHAAVLFDCFRDELDARIFRSFTSLTGCRELIRAIRARDGFLPGSTWLVATGDGPVGTIQGIAESGRWGAIQTVGMVPECRGMGLGEALLIKALAGFRAAGLARVYLEVTARNETAIRLYRKHGFRCTRTLYKGVEEREAASVGLSI
jgi:ribosomal protein S18 acetylase RimI-like enzyme